MIVRTHESSTAPTDIDRSRAEFDAHGLVFAVSTWVESNELWLPLQPPATFAVRTYFAKRVKSWDKPASFVYHHPDTRKMACCQYDYVSTDAWPRCSAGSRVGAGWWLPTSFLVFFFFLMDAPISFSWMAWSWLAN